MTNEEIIDRLDEMSKYALDESWDYFEKTARDVLCGQINLLIDDLKKETTNDE